MSNSNLTVAMILVLMLAGCTRHKELVILNLDLTPTTDLGRRMVREKRRGIELAVDDWDRKRIEIDNIQGKTSQDLLEHLKNLGAHPLVVGCVGPLSSDAISELDKSTLALNLLCVSPNASRNQVLRAALRSVTLVNRRQGRLLAKFIVRTLKLKSLVAVAVEPLDIDEKQIFDSLVKNVRKLGGKVFVHSMPTSNLKTLRPILAKEKPSAIFVPEYFSRALSLLEQLAAIKPGVDFIGPDSWNNPHIRAFARKNQVRIYYPEFYDFNNLEMRPFTKKYQEKFKARPSVLSALSYDTVALFRAAADQATNLERPSILKALTLQKRVNGAGGDFVIKNLQVLRPVFFVEVLDRRTQVLKPAFH